MHDVCTAIVDNLLERYIRIPTGSDAQAVVDGFLCTWGFPQCFGAVDGTHIRIIAPRDNPLDYYNRKGAHSIVLQALVDYEYKFMNIYVGWPGSVHDARILANSVVFDRGESGNLVPDTKQRINGVDVPIVILGDPAYPLLLRLIKPFSGTGPLSQEQKRFNYQLSRARVVVECAFGRLKGRWRSIMKRNDTNVSFMPTLVTACCILHNLCEIHGDSFDDNWLEADPLADASSATSTTAVPPANAAVAIRQALCDYFN